MKKAFPQLRDSFLSADSRCLKLTHKTRHHTIHKINDSTTLRKDREDPHVDGWHPLRTDGCTLSGWRQLISDQDSPHPSGWIKSTTSKSGLALLTVYSPIMNCLLFSEVLLIFVPVSTYMHTARVTRACAMWFL